MKLNRVIVSMFLFFIVLTLSGCELLDLQDSTNNNTTNHVTSDATYTTQMTTTFIEPTNSQLLSETLANMKNQRVYQNKVLIIKESSEENKMIDYSYIFDMEDENNGIYQIIPGDYEKSMYLELENGHQYLYQKKNELWVASEIYQEILDEKYYGALVNAHTIFENQSYSHVTLIEAGSRIDIYEAKVDGHKMFLSLLGMTEINFLNQYKITKTEFEQILSNTKLNIWINREDHLISYIEVDFTSIINQLFQLAKDRVDFNVPHFTTFKFENGYGNYEMLFNLSITEEMNETPANLNHSEIIATTFNNMNQANNYENKIIYQDNRSFVSNNYVVKINQLDKQSTDQWIIHHQSSFGDIYRYVDSNDTIYFYNDHINQWRKTDRTNELFKYLSSDYVLDNTLFNFINRYEDINVINTKNNLITYEFYSDGFSMMFLGVVFGNDMNTIINVFKLTENEYHELFKNLKIEVTIDTESHTITSIDMDVSNPINNLYQLAINRGVVLQNEEITSRLTMLYGRYNEIELMITDDINNSN